MSSPRLDSCQGKALGILLLVFLAGTGSGILGSRVYQITPQVDHAHDPTDGWHDPETALYQLQEELDLDSEQVTQVKTILDECIMMEAELLSKIKYMKAGGRDRILVLLDNQQRMKFQAVLHEVSNE